LASLLVPHPASPTLLRCAPSLQAPVEEFADEAMAGAGAGAGSSSSAAAAAPSPAEDDAEDALLNAPVPEGGVGGPGSSDDEDEDEEEGDGDDTEDESDDGGDDGAAAAAAASGPSSKRARGGSSSAAGAKPKGKAAAGRGGKPSSSQKAALLAEAERQLAAVRAEQARLQKNRLAFLLGQSELFAHFMALAEGKQQPEGAAGGGGGGSSSAVPPPPPALASLLRSPSHGPPAAPSGAASSSSSAAAAVRSPSGGVGSIRRAHEEEARQKAAAAAAAAASDAGAKGGKKKGASAKGGKRKRGSDDDGGDDDEEEGGGGGGAGAGSGAGGRGKGAGAGGDDDGMPVATTRLTRQPSIITGGTLRDYQLEGLNWMISLHENGLNGVLADVSTSVAVWRRAFVAVAGEVVCEHAAPAHAAVPVAPTSRPTPTRHLVQEMGLGKTFQTISLLGWFAQTHPGAGGLGPHIVLVPKSTLSNWVNEFKRFCPELVVITLHGDKEAREEVIRNKLTPGVQHSQRGGWNVLLTTYEVAVIESSRLARLVWQYVVSGTQRWWGRQRREGVVVVAAVDAITTAPPLFLLIPLSASLPPADH
jgi:hypothetical protein